MKYRIIYSDTEVVAVIDDIGTTFLADQHYIMIETPEDAKAILDQLGIDTEKLNMFISDE